MKRMFLLSACLIGMGLISCQKETLPEVPGSEQENAAVAAGEYAFRSDRDIIEIYLYTGGEKRATFVLLYNGEMAQGHHGTFWLEDIPGYPSINQYVSMNAGPLGPAPYYNVGEISFKEGVQLFDQTRGYLKFRATSTGETISRLVLAGPAPEL